MLILVTAQASAGRSLEGVGSREESASHFPLSVPTHACALPAASDPLRVSWQGEEESWQAGLLWWACHSWGWSGVFSWLSLWVVGRWPVEILSPETSELGFSCCIHVPHPLADEWWWPPHPWSLGGIEDSPRLAPSSVAPICSWQCGHFPVVTLLCWDTGIPEATLSRLELRASSGETGLQANQHLSLRNHLFALQPLWIDWSWGPA